METIGRIVKQRRQVLGLTLEQLATAVGVARSYLSMIENHRVASPPSEAILRRLEEALSISRGELTGRAQWETTSPDVKRAYQQMAVSARQGRELAQWLRQMTDRERGGGKNLDALYRSGQLGRRINAVIGKGGSQQSDNQSDADNDDTQAPAFAGRGGDIQAVEQVRYRVPVINSVAAGYPTDFSDLDYPARVADHYIDCPDLSDPDAFAARVVGSSMEPSYHEGDVVFFSPAMDVENGCDCFVRLDATHETTFKRVYFEEDGRFIRLQPLNPEFAPQRFEREQVAGMYRAVGRFSRI